MLECGTAMVRDTAEAGEIMPLVERNRTRVYSSGAVRQCVAAIESLFLASGGTALQDTHTRCNSSTAMPKPWRCMPR